MLREKSTQGRAVICLAEGQKQRQVQVSGKASSNSKVLRKFQKKQDKVTYNKAYSSSHLRTQPKQIYNPEI